MFENEIRKTSRTSFGGKPGANVSASRFKKKEMGELTSKVLVDGVKTEFGFKDKKNKSQFFSKDKFAERKSIDISKMLRTNRSVGAKKSKEKPRLIDQAYTEDRPKYESRMWLN
jgi:hypothetical protein